MDATTKSTLQSTSPTWILHRSLPGSSSSSPFFLLSFLFTFFFVLSQSQPTPGPIPSASPANPPTPSLKPSQASQSNLRIVLPLTLAIGLSIGTLFLVMGCFAFHRFRTGKRRAADTVADEKQSAGSDKEVVKRGTGIEDGDGSVRRFSWEEVETLTMNFSRVIGSGGFSTVYLAHFSGHRSLGAIKIQNGSERLNRVFKQELDILLRLQHQNIVKLLGYCDDREEGALVFEYVPNGTLQERLHGSRDCAPTKLSWRSRMAIAFQLAQAIEYLHEKCSRQIVHGDIKASNILLDQELNIKLCDFGFAKMGFSSTILPPSSSSSSMMKHVMMGSPGYTDPHYLRTGIASKKNDVYSFGVIVLELVTGMEAFCSQKGQLLASIAGPKLKLLEETTVAEMVDPNLGGEFDMAEAKAMLNISALCLLQAHTLRPSATQILEIIREKVSGVDLLQSSSLSPEKDSKVIMSLLN